MDLKDILTNSEGALPTLEGNLSTSTATLSLPTVTASSSTYLKFGVSSVLGLAGMLYLGMGKKEKDVGKMLLGAGLTIASMFLF